MFFIQDGEWKSPTTNFRRFRRNECGFVEDVPSSKKILATLRTDEAFIGMSKRSYMEVVMNGLNSNDLVDVGPISALVFQFQQKEPKADPAMGL
ncbi:hypothetical protein C5167_001260 [Papaver somniferum]|uniref:Uncharacterized protein n=1 Tax=Papaver somniferum TaxID=3469 RepID=A0A4Y7KWE2_PAPSO|nr:hypothetical protein C5167_001260 [Papaver somniferum]